MSLTKGDLQLISELMDEKLDRLESKMDEKLERLESRMDSKMDEKLKQQDDNWDRKLQANLAPLQSDVRGIKQKIVPLQSDVQGIKQKLAPLQSDVRDIKLMLETNVLPRLQNIESCYIDTYQRYAVGAEKIDVLEMDMKVVKQILAEHARKLQSISG